MKLSVTDRLSIQEATLAAKPPERTKMIEMLNYVGIIDAVKFSPEEISKFGLRDAENGGIAYNPMKVEDKEIELYPEQLEIIKRGVFIIDEQSKVSFEFASMAKKLGLV